MSVKRKSMSAAKAAAKNVPARVPERRLVKDAAAAWLERSNPLTGLSIQTAQNIFDCARQGDTQRLHWLYHEIEAKNPVLMTCIERRAAAIANFTWSVTPRAEADRSLADEQQAAVRELIANIANFTELLEHLDGAFFRGFALAQPVWTPDGGAIREVTLHNSWEFVRNDGGLFWCPNCNGIDRDSVDCRDAGLIGVERARAIDYPALAIHIRHAVGERDWGRFLERYALPKPAVTMAPNATNEQRGDYIVAAKAVENGQCSVWPNGSTITDFAGGSRGTDPFNAFIRHQEEHIVLLATGGTLTSLAQADTGSLAGGAQMEVWREIVNRDAGVLGQAVTAAIVRPFLERQFWGRPVAVDFALAMPKRLSPQEAAELAATLRTAGWRVNQAELEKATGFTLEREDLPAQGAFGSAKERVQSVCKGPEQPPKPAAATLEDALAAAMAEAIADELDQTRTQP